MIASAVLTAGKWLTGLLLVVLVGLGGLWLAWPHLPYRPWAAGQITAALETAGLSGVALEVDDIAPSHSTLKNIRLRKPVALSIPRLQIAHPLSPFSDPPVTLRLTADMLRVEQGALILNAGPVTVTALPEQNLTQASGTFSARNIALEGLPSPPPPLNLEGDYAYDGRTLTAKGTFQSADVTHRAQFTLTYPLRAETPGTLTLRSVRFPWGGGTIRAKETEIALSGTRPVPVTLDLQTIDLGTLLDTLSGEKVSGTGTISGTLPVTWHPDGTFTLRDGLVHALSDGTLNVSPGALPSGGRPDIDVVRTALQNFHYTSLKIHLSSDEAQRSKIRLEVKGNNPEAFEGRPIHLNVNLTGDVVPLIRHSILPMQGARQLLKTQEHP